MDSPSRRSRSRGRSPMSDDNDDRYRSRSPEDRANGKSDGSRSRSRDRSMSRGSTPPPVPKSCKIVIEKLTKNVNEGHLREIFGAYGEIQELEMPLNRQFMTNKGIAYVLYSKSIFAEDAISRMHEAHLDGAMISVSIVIPRRRFDRSPPPMRPRTGGFGEPHRLTAGGRGPAPPDRGYGRPQGRGSPSYGGRGGRRDSPDRGHGGRGGGGGGGGYRGDRPNDRYSYRPRSRSPHGRRSRSPRAASRSTSRTPPRRQRTPTRAGPGSSRRRRSASYSDYSSKSASPAHSRAR